eukprot:CAMPEP_0181429506 /NCGR_PEP_ID=MMETSP1110-20121109/17235_1 /TAXON_ID=174948 /ORGANISM="Symbiodinium sp., Strain CCMP421" /LENGTH=486 /DNA_ID=CAMNT_0023552777 /DNA_START=97 /DNA_END=1557 /DNA_ORIENTATION=-
MSHPPSEPGERVATQKEPGGSGLRTLSAEDKLRIGNLIKVLAQERKDKEELQQMLGQQASKMQDMEQERDRSRKKEAELVGRVARSLRLLKTCQTPFAGQGHPQAGTDADSKQRDDGEQPTQTRTQDCTTVQADLESSRCNALQDAEPQHVEDAELSTRPAKTLKVFSLKPPQLSLLQRYLSIQEESHCDAVPSASGPLPKRQWTPERARHPTFMADAAVQTPPSEATQISASSPRRRESLQQPKVVSPRVIQDPSPQRLRLGAPRRWRHRDRCKPEASDPNNHFASASSWSAQASLASPAISQSALQRRSQQPGPGSPSQLRCSEESDGLRLGSPVPCTRPGQDPCYSSDLGPTGLSWAPLRLDSYYAANMFDVIDSLESSPSAWGSEKARSQPVAIAEELRRLQRELVAIEHRVQKGSKVESALKPVKQAGQVSSPWLKAAVGHCASEDELELSREIDDVLHLLREKVSDKTLEVSSDGQQRFY